MSHRAMPCQIEAVATSLSNDIHCAIYLWHARWQEPDVKNFHLPLPEQTYSRLRAEAERTQVPATALAREAIDLWLRHQLRKARHQAISAYAEEMAGTNLDLDP